MAKLTIDGIELMMCLEDMGGQIDNYLDLDTGKTIMVADGEVNGEEVDDVDEALDDLNLQRIDPMDSRESFRIMDDFVAQLPIGSMRSKLREALSGPKPFRRFKDALYQFPQLKDSWHHFEEMRQREYLTELLTAFEIDFEIKWPERQAPVPPVPVKGEPTERVITEFVWATHKTEAETCRLSVKRTKKTTTVHIDYYNDDVLFAEGLAIAPEDIDPLIAALKRVKEAL